FISITIHSVRIGLWPSSQLADEQLILRLDPNAIGPVGRCKRRTVSPGVSGKEEDSENTLHFAGRSSIYYFDWATDIRLATTLCISTTVITFYSESDFLRVCFRGDHFCGKLLSTSDADSFNDSEAALPFKTGPVSMHPTSGVLFGHLGFQTIFDLVFEYRAEEPTDSFRDITELDRHKAWQLNSVCLKIFGFRAALMEEVIEILNQSLLVRGYASSLPNSSLAIITKQNAPFSRRTLMLTDHVQRLSYCGTTDDRHSDTVRSLRDYYPNRHPPYGFPTHLCVSFLPREAMNSARSQEEQLKAGFQFELIRFMFRRSIQIKFHSLRTSMDLVTCGTTDSAYSETPASLLSLFQPVSGGSTPNLSFLRGCRRIINSKLRFAPCQVSGFRSSPAPLSYVDWPEQESALMTDEFTKLDSMSFTGRLSLRQLHITSGWNPEKNCCVLDLKMGSLFAELQLRHFSCTLSVAVNTWQTICVHNPEEAEFHSQLIQIIRLTCALLSKQRREGISTWRSKWQTESPWYTNDLVSARSSGRSSLTCGLNSVTPIRRLKSFQVNSNSSSRTFAEILTMFELGQRRLSVCLKLEECVNRMESAHSTQWGASLDDVLDSAGTKLPPILFVLVPSSKSPGLQLGLEGFSVLAEYDPFGNGVIGLVEMVLRAECKLHLTGLYLGLSTTFPTQPEWPWSGAQVESSSCLLTLRSRQELLESVSLGLPVKGQHCFGHLFSLVHLSAQSYNRHVEYHLQGIQFEWPSGDVLRLYEALPRLLDGWSSLSHLDTLPFTAQTKTRVSSFDVQDYLKYFVKLTGHLEDINWFLISQNEAMILLRTDSVQFFVSVCADTVKSYSVENHLKQSLSLDEALEPIVHVTGTFGPTKMVYSVRTHSRTIENESQSSYPTLSCAALKHQLFWMPELQLEMKQSEKLVVVVCPQPVEWFWTLAVYLCVRDAISAFRQLQNGSPWFVNSKGHHMHSEVERPINEFRPSISSSRTPDPSCTWALRIRAPQTVQVFVQLITSEHQLAVCLRHAMLRVTAPRDRTHVDRTSDPGFVPSRFKLTCDKALVRFDNENIAIFENLNVRHRPTTNQHRRDFVKAEWFTEVNSAIEIAADLCYITFPYGYRFREAYLQFTSFVRFLRGTYSPESVISNCPAASSRKTVSRQLMSTSASAQSILNRSRSQSQVASTFSSPSVRPDSQCVEPALALSLRPDYIICLKRFVLEVKDDPFESQLSDNYMVLLSEQINHEQRIATLRSKLSAPGLRLTDADRLACFARLEEQRASEYRTRVLQFKQEFPASNELFSWTLDDVRLRSLTDHAFSSPEQMVEKIHQMDSCSPWPNLTAADFCTLWCRMISLNVDCWRFRLRDYPKPWLEMTDLFLWGHLAGAERLADFKGQHTVKVIPGKPWPEEFLVRNGWPLKFYYDLTADLKTVHMCYGSNWEPTVAWLSQRWEDVIPRPRDKSPRLGWWDKVRHLLHGRLYIVSESMHWYYSTSLNPYNATEFFTWQWTRSTVCWETGQFRLEGDLDIMYQTASKYDGVCHLMHLPGIDMSIILEWLSLGNPFDHHSVRPCDFERLAELGIVDHDSYQYFRGNRLALQITCTVCSSSTPALQQPWGLFYTSVLKFADKLRMCLNKIARPIRRGSAFSGRSVRKPLFGRLLQWMDFTFSLPKLELNYWVSYANRTGVHLTTGPVRLTAELRHSVERESKVLLDSTRISSGQLQSYVMLPPSGPVHHTGGLVRRPTVTWSVVRLSASLHDSRIRLKHHANLPGQVVQMLLKSATLMPTDCGTNHNNNNCTCPPNHTTEVSDPAEDFIMVPLVHYEQVSPTALSPGDTVRVHISGRKGNSVLRASKRGKGQKDSLDVTRRTPETVSKSQLVTDPDRDVQSTVDQPTHESLTPTHRLVVNDLKLRWTEHNRNLVFTLMNTYQHAQSLKRNLSARAIHALQLRPTAGAAGSDRISPAVNFNRGLLGDGSSSSSNIRSHSSTYQCDTVPSADLSVVDLSETLRPHCGPVRAVKSCASLQHAEDGLTTDPNAQNEVHSVGASAASAMSGELSQIPMLTQLLEEVDTARFYAYCEQEPKQTDVISQLHGLTICSESPVFARNWHVELVNSQLLLKTDERAGYVLVTAARAILDALAHPPIWKDAQLLNKSSLVGHLECMQYYATVGQVDPGQPDQWLSTADVTDWAHFYPDADEDALSGRPEVVGCGRSAGGVVSACPVNPSSYLRSGSVVAHTAVGFPDAKSPRSAGIADAIQLQRMIARCSCEVFYVHYEPVNPRNLPLSHLIPPLPLDETEVVQTPEGADTVTLLHHKLQVCTNSVQYHMIVDIVNDLLLYVEPQRKAQSERNRVAFGLMSESQVRTAILRDQQMLRCLVADQRRLERELWSFVRRTMPTLGVEPGGVANGTSSIPNEHTLYPLQNAAPLAYGIDYARRLEAQIAHLKMRIIEQNALLSQRLAHYQQLQVQAQRRHMCVAMNRVFTHATTDDLIASTSSVLKQRRSAEDHSSLSPIALIHSSTSVGQRRSDGSGSKLTELCLTDLGSEVTGRSRKLSMMKQDSYPAEIVRRSEVCFEHALWRMTENDGQIGLADVELRGFLYVKTNRQDDSGSHWLELGWIHVDSLGPKSFFKEVLVPDVGGGQYAGGPILRISCSQLAPVGGISVKEAMEVSVAPMALQVSKQFYRLMMPYFFPEKPEGQGPSEVRVNASLGDGVTSDRMPCLPVDTVDLTMGNAPSGRVDALVACPAFDQTTMLRTTDWTKKRLYQAPNLIRSIYRGHINRPGPTLDLIAPASSSHLVPDPVHDPLLDAGEPNSCNLTVEAALTGQTSCSVDVERNELTGASGFENSGMISNLAGTFSQQCFATRECPPAENGPLPSFPSTLVSWPPSVGSVYPDNLPQPVTNWSLQNEWKDPCSSSRTLDPVDVMRERARRNNVFLYIKIPGFPICLSYKGEKQKNLTDVTRFQLNIPTLEYHNCVWTWLDFAMEVKTRIRKQLVREVIKKKFTPRRRLPFVGLTRSLSARTQVDSAPELPHNTLTTVFDTATRLPDASSTTAQEERARKEVEMLLGRHAQLLQQPRPPGKWHRFRHHR
ncbi:hypothetical protein EG68_04772, partial [Paragonimus skrjabini miyazakii]